MHTDFSKVFYTKFLTELKNFSLYDTFLHILLGINFSFICFISFSQFEDIALFKSSESLCLTFVSEEMVQVVISPPSILKGDTNINHFHPFLKISQILYTNELSHNSVWNPRFVNFSSTGFGVTLVICMKIKHNFWHIILGINI